MAYINAEKAAEIRKNLKAALPGWKLSVRIEHHSSLQVTVVAAPLDLLANARANQRADDEFKPVIKDELQCNHYYLDRSFSGEALEALETIKQIANEGNFDESDTQSDYFHVGWYFNLSIGAWNKPFVCTAPKQTEQAA